MLYYLRQTLRYHRWRFIAFYLVPVLTVGSFLTLVEFARFPELPARVTSALLFFAGLLTWPSMIAREEQEGRNRLIGVLPLSRRQLGQARVLMCLLFSGPAVLLAFALQLLSNFNGPAERVVPWEQLLLGAGMVLLSQQILLFGEEIKHWLQRSKVLILMVISASWVLACLPIFLLVEMLKVELDSGDRRFLDRLFEPLMQWPVQSLLAVVMLTVLLAMFNARAFGRRPDLCQQAWLDMNGLPQRNYP